MYFNRMETRFAFTQTEHCSVLFQPTVGDYDGDDFIC